MAKVLVHGHVLTLATVDYSSLVEGVDIEVEASEEEITNMTSTDAWREFLQGLKGYSVSVSLVRDADLSGLDAAIWAAGFASGAAGTMAFTAKRSSGAIAPANPEWQGTLVITGHQPLAGAVGSAFKSQINWRGTGPLVRDITP